MKKAINNGGFSLFELKALSYINAMCFSGSGRSCVFTYSFQLLAFNFHGLSKKNIIDYPPIVLLFLVQTILPCELPWSILKDSGVHFRCLLPTLVIFLDWLPAKAIYSILPLDLPCLFGKDSYLLIHFLRPTNTLQVI